MIARDAGLRGEVGRRVNKWCLCLLEGQNCRSCRRGRHALHDCTPLRATRPLSRPPAPAMVAGTVFAAFAGVVKRRLPARRSAGEPRLGGSDVCNREYPEVDRHQAVYRLYGPVVGTVIGDEGNSLEVSEVTGAEHGVVVQAAAVIAGEVRRSDIETAELAALFECQFERRFEDRAPLILSDLSMRFEANRASGEILDRLEHGAPPEVHP